MSCHCNQFDYSFSGGCVSAGEATVSHTSPHRIATGGTICSGSAVVDIVGALYDGFAGVWPLNEEEQPYLDLTSYKNHGTNDFPPTQVDGVLCSYGQEFEGREWISMDADSISPESAFTISMMVKRTEFYGTKVLFTRGGIFELGYSAIGSPYAFIITDTGEEYLAVGTSFLQQDVWYHFAAVLIPGESLSVYVNGVLDGSVEITETATLENDANQIGDVGTRAVIQEVRLWPEAKDAAYLRMERASICGGLYEAGESEDALVS